jgi:hypothetical protein
VVRGISGDCRSGRPDFGAERLWVCDVFATRTRFGLWFRNIAMRMMNYGPLTTLFGGGVRDDFELPDYQL